MKWGGNMKKIFMLSMANIRKTKGHTVSIFLMFIIASMLLNLGLLVFINFGGFFNKITKELNSSDVYYLMPKALYSDRVDEYIRNNNNTKIIQSENPLWLTGTIPYNKVTRECIFLINDADKSRILSKWKFVGESLPPDSMSIYIPYVMNIDGGYRLNDKLQVNFKDKIITFTVKGFIEDTFFSSLDTAVMGVYLPHDTFERVKEMLGDKYDATLIYANLEKMNKDTEAGIREIIKQDNPNNRLDANSTLLSLDIELVKLSRNLMASGVSVMMMAYAFGAAPASTSARCIARSEATPTATRTRGPSASSSPRCSRATTRCASWPTPPPSAGRARTSARSASTSRAC
jgi:putative ABC transport system permease protein